MKDVRLSRKSASRKKRKPDVPLHWHRFLPILVVLSGLIVYLNSFAGVFLFDDTPHIVKNDAFATSGHRGKCSPATGPWSTFP